MKNFDVVVLGAGPGGYVAAIRAAQLGKKTAVIEKEHLGGICLNWGCIPTKSLIKSAELYQSILQSEQHGITAQKIEVDINKMVAKSRMVSSKLVNGIKGLLQKNNVTLIEGEAKLQGAKQLIINSDTTTKTTVRAENIIIATGARARILKGFEPNTKNIWTYKEALVPKFIPKSMVIVGSGAIGIEFACFYNALGSNVTVLESQDRILPIEDEEISKIAQKSFERKGIKFKTGIKLLSQHINHSIVTINVESRHGQEEIDAEILLMAVGIRGNTENIGLETTEIDIKNGHILTNSMMQTSNSGLYAIGDVTGAPWLAHKASHEGIIAAEAICGINNHHMIKNTNIPGCTYSMPQIASVGLTEKVAIESGYNIKVGRFPFYANAKALIIGEGEGLVKTVFDEKTGEILGAHMIGENVTELIQGYVVAKEMEGTEIDLMNTIFPHPTLSETIHESVLQAFGKPIHI